MAFHWHYSLHFGLFKPIALVAILAVISLNSVSAADQKSPTSSPPRTTNDILNVLDARAEELDENFLAMRRRADLEISETLPLQDKAVLFAQRAIAAGQLGRAVQEIRDLTKSLNSARAMKNADLVGEMSFRLGMAQIRAGDFEAGRKLVEAHLADQSTAPAGSMSASALEAMVRSGKLGEVERIRREVNEVLFTLEENGDLNEAQKAGVRAALQHGQAMLLDLVGDLEPARKAYVNAIKSWEDFAGAAGGADIRNQQRRVSNLLRTRLADNLLRQGRYVLAEVESRQVLLETLELNGRFSYQMATVLQTFTRVLFEQGRLDEASLLASEALRIFSRAGVSATALNHLVARSLLGEILVAAEDWPAAAKLFETVSEDLADSPEYRERFIGAATSYGLLQLQRGDVALAEKVFIGALRRMSRIYGAEGLEALEAGALLAAVYSRSNRPDLSRKTFQRYLPPLIRQFRERSADPSRSTIHDRRLETIIEEYIRMLLKLDGDGAPSLSDRLEAFRMTDLIRSRGLRSAVAASAARGAVSDPALAKLVRREQDAGLQIVGLEVLISDTIARSRESNPAVLGELSQRLAGLRALRNELQQSIREEFPRYADLTNPEPATVDGVKKLLRPDEALISIYSGRHGTYVFAVSSGGDILTHNSKLVRAELDDIVRELRVVPHQRLWDELS